jgi:hypothetical protein
VTLKNKWIVLYEDLRLLASLYIAHFIVWRKVRTTRKERAVRLKNLKLIKGSTQSSNGRKAPVRLARQLKSLEMFPDSRIDRRV